MGSNCSHNSQASERSTFNKSDSFGENNQIFKPQMDSILGASQMTQMDIPNAQLPSPIKPLISKYNEIKSVVRIPTEESIFQKEFYEIKECKPQNPSKTQKILQPKIQINLQYQNLRKNQQNKQQSSKFFTASPKKKQQEKSNSQSPLQKQCPTFQKSSKKRESPNYIHVQKDKIVTNRKYSDIPQKKDKHQIIRRKISDICVDHTYIIRLESPTKFRSLTPNSILKRKDLEIQTNSSQKKQVRFKNSRQKNSPCT
ncbi:unnamed protein product (macronuclear) [Paramecium tetraurelia]|uniref:Uncharacterized protein n=1 Tax=Paramecium tetraurelia TaxID=5888 RepID=A0BIC3_PARTE|nr:uncharacterized protein GSPATT00004662001 [Paramecium tetraurelia]CAK58290.1 unnamed protein product [Paramecium tetraurelia]|eukprot:XP_001425688.1 hypothetical protein (macronuclear) [Paramecium tetraurelia strain d4-2]